MAAWGKSRDHARAQPRQRQRDLTRRPQDTLRPPRDPRQDQLGGLRGSLLRLQLRAEETERVLGLYRSLGGLLQAESGVTRTLLWGAELELLRRRRRLRELRERGGSVGRGGAPAQVRGSRRARGARPRALEELPGPPDPPQESPEPEEGPRGPPPTLPLPHPEETLETPQETPPDPSARAQDPLGSTDPQVSQVSQVSLSPRVRALSQHLQQLRGEVEALRGQLRGSHLGGTPRSPPNCSVRTPPL
ncbi:splicing factor, proline- and glutamine-rich-like isoform X2 [Pipra filicauda]|uniref:Splicing factor, proline- and glutamine-rich-like isoform X2 n=1 Tax=Pipra filicauda TaxID=649802 RepID=A0A7R5JZ04_9PASS|nr:splicing factor, proline- and glutamine-rich-like isoform X2 [Pipra filicauda]